jgi:hypothetical protein
LIATVVPLLCRVLCFLVIQLCLEKVKLSHSLSLDSSLVPAASGREGGRQRKEKRTEIRFISKSPSQPCLQEKRTNTKGFHTMRLANPLAKGFFTVLLMPLCFLGFLAACIRAPRISASTFIYLRSTLQQRTGVRSSKRPLNHGGSAQDS